MKIYSEENRIRPDILTSAVYLAVIIMMLFAIFSIRIFGDKGAGFVCGPLAFFYIFYAIFVLAVQKAVWLMVRIRARRSQYVNAEHNMKRSLRFFAVCGVIAAGVLVLITIFGSTTLFGSNRGFFQGIIAAASILFLAVQGVLRGYLQGIGYTKPIMISDIIIAAVAFGSGILFTGMSYGYGVKVNALFHVGEFSAVYGSTGMMIGILIASIAGFLQIGISFYLRRGELRDIVKGGAPRYLDSTNDVLTGVQPLIFLYATPGIMLLFDQIFYVIHQTKIGSDTDIVLNYGIYAGRVITMVVLFSLLVCMPFIKTWNRIMARAARDEFDGARSRYASFIKKFLLLVLPVVIFAFALASPIEVAFFGKSSDLADNLLRIGSVMIFLVPIAVFTSWMLNHMGKAILIVTNLTIAWLFHIGLNVVFEIILNMGLYGIVIATIVSIFVYDLLCLLMFGKMFKMKTDNVRIFVLPLACSAVAGLIVFFVSMGLVNLIGDILTIAICFVIFYIVYIAALILLKLVNYHELGSIPFGKAFYGLYMMFGGYDGDEE
ncbi:hypothetical protein D6853_04535 [Butyrivibrio sp. X503]|uniref:polysaccharide biosynthesis C-terminal domain-containing protein n=1 Tax=Butyrivibrio sp. X503 TaxID=2364878 RepID=UPI000EAA1BDD|nr:polysaccharide biosynthesis C-terminal domain-containing protein [Butyrivibrio sp. X503]RKM57285.1 hypothetical protein D6853_04535 [Butyrivibrio sp. X503]